MRIAIMADIHGFNIALDAVLEDIQSLGPFDHVVIAGDLCEGGPAPVDVIDRIRSLALPCVQGNTDRDIADGSRRSASATWTRSQIGAQGIAFLADLPFEKRIKPLPNVPEEFDLLIVHANPNDLDHHIRPDATDREIANLVGGVRAAVIAFGHLHIPYERRVGTTLLLNVSSAGNPKDGDLRCVWGIVEWDDSTQTWRTDIRRIPYPIEATVAQIRRSSIPDPEALIESLLRASY